jgi:hypothetical protein
MIDIAVPADPVPMEGRGAYNHCSTVQATGSSPALPLLERAAHLIPIPDAPEPIVIADYGSSQGRNSLAPMAAAIGVLRKRVGMARAISVVHTDLPGNDFAALFQMLTTSSDSYLASDQAIFPSAIGRSFYDQILPSGSVTLAWSSWAVQWLSQIPAPLPDQLQVAYSRDHIAKAAYHQQAAEDWRQFLTHRGEELRLGGRLVVLTMAVRDDGDFGYRPQLVAMHDALTALVEDGLVTADEARQMVIPTVGRSRQDLIGPFAATGRFAHLVVENVEIFEGQDDIWAEFEKHGNARIFGAQWAAFSRASVFPTLAANLKGGRDDPRAAAFIDRLESGMAARLATSPQRTLIPLGKIELVKAE